MKIFKETTLLLEGITHIEDLPIEIFINSIENINNFIISEKLDGANLHFGLDENGKYFSSREGKGGKKFYNFSDWGDKFWQVGFKSAHLALEKISKYLKEKKLLLPGDTIEVEVLFGQLPNTVPYSGEMNQLIMLRPISSGTGDKKELESRFEQIKKFLENKKITIEVKNVPKTDDGKNIYFVNENHSWVLSQTPKIPNTLLNKEQLRTKLKEKLDDIKEYLKEESKIGRLSNIEILGIRQNKKPNSLSDREWLEFKNIIELKKEEILNKLKDFKLGIKEELLDNFVRQTASAFGPSLDQGGWIEGLVFRNPDTNEQFKLVDKDLFTAMNKFNWKIRNLLKTTSPRTKIPDITGRLIKYLADYVGAPQLARSANANAYLRKMIKNNLDPIKELAKNIEFSTAKQDWVEKIDYYKKLLNKLYNWYIKNHDKLEMKFGKNKASSAYTGELNQKTKQAFAELYNDLDYMSKNFKNAKSSEDLVNYFIGERLKNLNESILTEGGNIFRNSGAITIYELDPTLKKIASKLDLKYEDLKDNLLGSSGKAKISGDIDVILPKSSGLTKEKFKEKASKIFGNQNVKSFGDIVSIFTPIENYDTSFETEKPRTGNVQIDFFIIDSTPEWTKFYYHSPSTYSKLKGIHRLFLINSVLKHINSIVSNKLDSFGRPIEIEKWSFSPKFGLKRIIIKSKKDKDGKWMLNQEKIETTNVITDPVLAAKMILGKKATINDLDSVENIVKFIKKYYPDKADLIFSDFADKLDSKLLNYEFPAEIEKYIKR